MLVGANCRKNAVWLLYPLCVAAFSLHDHLKLVLLVKGFCAPKLVVVFDRLDFDSPISPFCEKGKWGPTRIEDSIMGSFRDVVFRVTLSINQNIASAIDYQLWFIELRV